MSSKVKGNAYPLRITAFIDILGFKGISKQINNFYYTFDLLENTDEIMHVIANENSEGQSLEGFEATCFSDSIVISADFDCENVFSNFLLLIQWLTEKMLIAGATIRGGITANALYHKNNKVFGKAMVEAYELENESAIYPRIIIAKSRYDEIVSQINDITYEKNDYIKSLIDKDIDGFYYFNYFNMFKGIDNKVAERRLYLENLRRVIGNGLSNKDISIQQKYFWMVNKFNSLEDLDEVGIPKIVI